MIVGEKRLPDVVRPRAGLGYGGGGGEIEHGEVGLEALREAADPVTEAERLGRGAGGQPQKLGRVAARSP